MKETYVFLTTGFEEIEALATIDILFRGGVRVKSVSLTDKRTVVGSHQISVMADLLFNEVDFSNAEMLVLPGGTVKINEHEGLRQQVKAFVEADKPVAAICAAPIVLGSLGLLQGKRATCYPGFEQYLTGAMYTEAPVMQDGNIITGRGPGYTIDFALAILEMLKGKDNAVEVSNQVFARQ